MSDTTREELESRFADEMNAARLPNQQKRRLIALFVEALDHKPAIKRRAKNESVR